MNRRNPQRTRTTSAPLRVRSNALTVANRSPAVRDLTPTDKRLTVVNGVPVPVQHAKLAARSGTGATIGAVVGAVLLGPAGAIFGAAAGGAIGAASSVKKKD